jgi:hypothetical protein
MRDTSKKIEEIYHRMMMERTPEERVKMCFSMLGSAKEIVKSTINDKTNWRVELFLRLYSNDFDRKTQEEIIKAIKNYSEQN